MPSDKATHPNDDVVNTLFSRLSFIWSCEGHARWQAVPQDDHSRALKSRRVIPEGESPIRQADGQGLAWHSTTKGDLGVLQPSDSGLMLKWRVNYTVMDTSHMGIYLEANCPVLAECESCFSTDFYSAVGDLLWIWERSIYFQITPFSRSKRAFTFACVTTVHVWNFFQLHFNNLADKCLFQLFHSQKWNSNTEENHFSESSFRPNCCTKILLKSFFCNIAFFWMVNSKLRQLWTWYGSLLVGRLCGCQVQGKARQPCILQGVL